MKNILIGTMSRGNADTPAYIRYLGGLGFECTEITFGHDCSWLMSQPSLPEYAAACKQAVDDSRMEMSALGVYGNPLTSDDAGALCRKSWELLIDNAALFGTKLLCGFTGCLPGKSVPEAIPQFKAVFSELTARAAEKGVSIAFENCPMGGNWNSATWNLAFHPQAWELMFEAVPAENLGLEWEPAHQMCQLIDPLPQLREWAPKVFHVHGKDATVDRVKLARYGIHGAEFPVYHRTPGFGDCNWSDVFSILRRSGYQGNVDIEGWHDLVYRGDWEMTGQVHGMHYLKNCRGEDFIPAFQA